MQANVTTNIAKTLFTQPVNMPVLAFILDVVYWVVPNKTQYLQNKFMTLAFPMLVRVMHNWFPLGSRSLTGSLGNSPGQPSICLQCRHVGFYQFSNGMTIWPYLLTHLMTHEKSNTRFEQSCSHLRVNIRKMVWFRILT